MTQSILKSISPTSLQQIGQRKETSAEEVFLYKKKAVQASVEWKKTSFKERAKIILTFRKKLLQQKEAVAKVITNEIGKPILQSYMAEIYPATMNMKYLCQKGPQWLSNREEIPPLFINGTTRVQLEPYGVIGIIGTWNYPLLLNLSTITEALMAGNTVLFKPSELAWMIAEKCQTLWDESGLPQGVFQTIYGGPETGKALLEAGADKYFFTGSAAIGKAIQKQLAETNKPSVLELSGNDPMIVREDSPVALSAKAAVWGSMIYSGQNCISIKRLFVNQKIFTLFKEKMLSEINKLTVGPAQDWKTDLGPLRREQEILKCESLVEDALNNKAVLLTGGKRTLQTEPGYYFEPTLIESATTELGLCREDFFGPIAVLTPVQSDEEAIQKANENDFGLGAAIFSNNIPQAENIARQLDCGMVTINEVIWPIALPMLPFGGVKKSGFGRNRGLEGIREMVYAKSLFVKSAKDRFRPYYFQPYSKWTPKIAQWAKWFYK